MVLIRKTKNLFKEFFKKFKKNQGFTLVEILVALGIFSIAIGIVSETFVSSVKIQRKFLASTESLNEISYLMEYMARSIRMARKDTAPACLSAARLNYEITRNGQGIKYLAKRGPHCQEFYLDGETIYESRDNGAEINALTSPKIKVIAFNIGPGDSWDENDEEQPKVVVYLELESSDKSRIKMQTTISQRNMDRR